MERVFIMERDSSAALLLSDSKIIYSARHRCKKKPMLASQDMTGVLVYTLIASPEGKSYFQKKKNCLCCKWKKSADT
jgi:hypothetical protein